jgi:hypothetical protein
MNLTYTREGGSHDAYLRFASDDRRTAKTIQIRPGLVVEADNDGSVLGIEIMGIESSVEMARSLAEVIERMPLG